MQLIFGQSDQVKFIDKSEYYYVLGFLASSNYTSIHWEMNEEQGAWANEGRIHFYEEKDNYPKCFKFTMGKPGIYSRVNCNDYVRCLIEEHGFVKGKVKQDFHKIKSTVPVDYLDIFMEGSRFK